MAKVYKGAFSGTLPVTMSGTGSGVLASYRIFGNDGGVGVETEASGYKLPILSNSTVTDIFIGDTPLAKDEYVDSNTGKIYRRTKNLSPPEEEWIDGQIGGGDGTVSPSTQIKVSPFIDVSTCETCIMEVFSAETEWAAAGYRGMAFYDENKQYLGWIGGGGRRVLTPNSSERLSEFPAGTVYVRIECSHGDQPFYPQLVSGYTPTHHFYPYLVPTDPPAPLPEIPTFAGTTVIDYAGEGLAPSQFDGVAGWGNLPVKKLNGVPYTGTLPATLTGTKAGYLYKYEVYGDTVQDGTPTPENPIMPEGVGERTENLCKISADNSISYSTYTQYSIADDTVYTTGNTLVAFICKVAPNTQYTVSTTATMGSSLRIREYSDFPDNWESGFVTQSLSVACSINSPTSGTIITNANTHYIGVTLFTINKGRFTDIMLAEGSTPLPYEPYGYKLPLTVNGVEYPIYLGEAETTRRIKKLVLTGEETWYKSALFIGSAYVYLHTIAQNAMPFSPIVCTHSCNNTRPYRYGNGRIDNNSLSLWLFNSSVEVADFKSYLAAQYAAGTPVTVWYVLAEPETGIVNEPLMKIGDYADTVDSEQSTVQIPTAAGETTISWAGQGLAPSEFDSIQEWVDIPTYTRVNGKWIADFETVIYGFHVDPSISDPANAVTYLLDAVGKTPATNSSSVVEIEEDEEDE